MIGKGVFPLLSNIYVSYLGYPSYHTVTIYTWTPDLGHSVISARRISRNPSPPRFRGRRRRGHIEPRGRGCASIVWRARVKHRVSSADGGRRRCVAVPTRSLDLRLGLRLRLILLLLLFDGEFRFVPSHERREIVVEVRILVYLK